MLVVVHERRGSHVPVLVPLDELLRGEFGRVAPQAVGLARVGVVIFGLVHAHGIDLERNLPRLHHVAESGIEGARALGIVAVVALRAPVRNVVGEGPRRRDGRVDDDVARLFGDLGSHGFLQGEVWYVQRVLPVLTLAIPFNVKNVTVLVQLLVRFGEPVQPSSASRLPLHAEGVGRFEVLGDELLHGPHGVRLEGLIFVSEDGLVGLGDAQVGPVEEGVETGVPSDRQVVVPVFRDGGGEARAGFRNVTNGLRA
mmetsp:Transcript_4898/g.8818  ORF Transcript_4898/g.8818 Transcript_4898/m.8818 type:complete len:255 (-) Transcript_4898:844-1608(-)